jgi:hypothetical protein
MKIIGLLTLSIVGCGEGFQVATGPSTPSDSVAADIVDVDETSDDGSNPQPSSTPGSGQAKRCQSDTFCVHDKMPVWSQFDGSKQGVLRNGTVVMETLDLNGASTPLLQYVQNQGYSQVTKDPGWCGAVSFAVTMKTWELELRERGEAPVASDVAFVRSDDASEVIFNVMGLLKMNPVIGVSAPDAHKYAYTAMRTSLDKGLVKTSMSMISVSDFRETYGRPLITLGVGNKSGGHFLAVHGTDGQYFVINDPWGATYSVTVSKSTVEKDGPSGKYYDHSLNYTGSGIKSLSSTISGFIPTTGPTSGVLNLIMLSDY